MRASAAGTKEIGLRMALGANRRGVVTIALGRALSPPAAPPVSIRWRRSERSEIARAASAPLCKEPVRQFALRKHDGPHVVSDVRVFGVLDRAASRTQCGDHLAGPDDWNGLVHGAVKGPDGYVARGGRSRRFTGPAEGDRCRKRFRALADEVRRPETAERLSDQVDAIGIESRTPSPGS